MLSSRCRDNRPQIHWCHDPDLSVSRDVIDCAIMRFAIGQFLLADRSLLTVALMLVLRSSLSVFTECIVANVAKRCVLEQKLLLTLGVIGVVMTVFYLLTMVLTPPRTAGDAFQHIRK